MPARRVVMAEYFSSSSSTLLFIVRSDFDHPAVIEIAKGLDDIRRCVREHFGAELNPNGELVRRAGDKARALDEDAYQHFFAPFVAPLLSSSPRGDAMTSEGDVIWFVPHDVLHYVPMHSLKLDGRYLVERNPTCYTASASLMKYCHARRKPQHGGKALVLGDPLGDLPFSRLESQQVASLFGVAAALGQSARKSLLLENLADPDERRALDVLHLACHGYFVADEALKSGIMLAAEEVTAALTAEEVFGLELQAELVTLSACESGVNERHPGDELIGLTRALIYAGTPSVLVSLWAVDDLSTALLMERFYRTWRAGSSKAVALQDAQCWLRSLPRDHVLERITRMRDELRPLFSVTDPEDERAKRLWRMLDGRREQLVEDYGPDDPPFTSLFHWAPFTLIGDWQ